MSARLPDGRTVTKDLSIPVQRQDAAVSRRMKVTVAPDTEQTVDLSPLGAFRPGTGRITLAAASRRSRPSPEAIHSAPSSIAMTTSPHRASTR